VPVNFTWNTVTRFDYPGTEDNAVQLITSAQAAQVWGQARTALGLGSADPVRFNVTMDVTVDAYTPQATLDMIAFGYIDARPSMNTAAEFRMESAAGANANRGTRLRFPTVVAEFQYAEPQTFWFMVNIGAAGPGSWVALRSISGTATELAPL